MRENIFIITILLMIFLFTGCEKKNKNKINDLDKIVLSHKLSPLNGTNYVIEDSYLIPLETSEQALLGNVTILKSYGNNIFVSDGQKIVCYRLEKNIGRINWYLEKIGKGPGEYAAITDFTINDKYLIVYSDFKIVFYDIHNREFLKMLKVHFAAREVMSYKKYLIFYTTFYQNTREYNYELLVLDTETNKINKYFKNSKKYLGSVEGHQLYNNNGSAFYCPPFRNVIYNFTEEGIPKPLFVLIDNENYIKIFDINEDNGMNKPKDLIKSEYYYSFSNIFFVNDYLSFQYCRKGHFYRMWYNIKNKKAFVSAAYFSPTTSVNNYVITIHNSYDVSQFNPEDYKNDKKALHMYKYVLNVKAEDNPCLLLKKVIK